MNRDAMFSQDGRFRYLLTRSWGRGATLLFCMLNPSTADANVDDPTIRKCVGFAKRFDYKGIEVVNLFAYRATDPSWLPKAGWPVGPRNDEYLRSAFASHARFVCAWGSHAKSAAKRRAEVLALARTHCCAPYALRVNADGMPAHPLMLPYSCELVEYGINP